MTQQRSRSSPPASPNRVRVVARIRPLSKTEQGRGSKEVVTSLRDLEDSPKQQSDEPELVEARSVGGGKRWFELDAVFGKNSTQEQVYVRSGACKAVTEDIFKGYNATILAYGQTGSGKTHSMGTAVRGNAGDGVAEEDGMIPRACVDLFEQVNQKCDGNARVELSYLEIYNEEIRDLLGSSENLKIRETLNGEVYVSGLASKEVTCPQDIGLLMQEASSKRVVASTAMNAVSSRSHAICTLRISGVMETNGEVDKFTSKLTLVDLAGSERIKKTGAQGNRRQEGISINKGLFVLGQVVSALAESGKNGHSSRRPPYRESKLTRLLQDSLGGNSRTIMVVCVSPADFNIEESINTLRYATSARKIKSNATRNIIKNISPEEAAALRRENQLLKTQVSELQETVGRLTQSGLRRDLSLCESDDVSDINSSDEMGDSSRVSSLEKEVAALKKQLKQTQVGLQETTGSAMQVPKLKMELEMLREQVKTNEDIEAENLQLRQELDEAKSDADSARIAAAKLSAILDQLKELRRDEIEKKKEELKYLKKDEAWVVFMDTLLEGRSEQMNGLAQDFDLVRKVLQSPATFLQESGDEEDDAKSTRSWWSRRKESDLSRDSDLRQRVIDEHTEFFRLRMEELQNDIKMESHSLKQMRDSILKDCSALQDEIGRDEGKEDRLEMVGREDMLAKLKKVWSSARSP